jgi:hypothetical protein
MAGRSPIAAGGLPPLATGGPAAFAERPPIGPGGATRVGLSGPASLLGERPAPRGALAAARRPGSAGRRGPAVASVVRSTSVTYNRFGDNGRYGGYRYGYGAAYATGAYAAAATACYVYGRSRDRYNSDSGCNPRITAPPNWSNQGAETPAILVDPYEACASSYGDKLQTIGPNVRNRRQKVTL